METKITKGQISFSITLNGTEEIETFRDILGLAFWLSKTESLHEDMTVELLSAIREARGSVRLSKGRHELAQDFVVSRLIGAIANEGEGDTD